MKEKILIIRFSSFGDLVQTAGVLTSLRAQKPDLDIHWLVRQDMKGAIENRKEIDRIWPFERKKGFLELLSLCQRLRKENYSYIYDAHSSLRSLFVLFYLVLFTADIRFIRRRKFRFKRFLLFKLRINTFEKPYRSMLTYWRPLAYLLGLKKGPVLLERYEKQNISIENDIKNKIILAPSAAWEMKRWPLDYFKRLIDLVPHGNFIVLGGPDDQFCQELADHCPTRVENLAGKVSLKESCDLVSHGKFIISADTGLIHVADMMGTPGVLLMGPTAFGGTTYSHIKILEKDLDCRPCTKDGRGHCSQNIYQKCMVEILPEEVAKEVISSLQNR